jgi:hypothetical protein
MSSARAAFAITALRAAATATETIRMRIEQLPLKKMCPNLQNAGLAVLSKVNL